MSFAMPADYDGWKLSGPAERTAPESFARENGLIASRDCRRCHGEGTYEFIDYDDEYVALACECTADAEDVMGWLADGLYDAFTAATRTAQ